jgi:DNA-directed RNA polymerase subunit omega
LAEKVDSKYTLVILAAKRARELTVPGVNAAEKEVSSALKEISVDTITFERTKNV